MPDNAPLDQLRWALRWDMRENAAIGQPERALLCCSTYVADCFAAVGATGVTLVHWSHCATLAPPSEGPSEQCTLDVPADGPKASPRRARDV